MLYGRARGVVRPCVVTVHVCSRLHDLDRVMRQVYMRQSAIAGLVIVCAVLMTSAAAAQGTSAAAIAGVVKDASGGILPGVTVEATSPALIERVRSTVTDDKGEFRIVELRPGTYSVTFTLPGFSVLKREGIELTSNFTAVIQAEMKLGSLEETVTVTGESPLVDIQNVTQGTILQKPLLDAVPTNRTIGSLIALMPAIVSPPSGADVGGSMGESTGRISIHGSKLSDGKQLQDGMRVNPLTTNGGSRGHVINSLSAQEVIVETGSGGSAEYSTAGAVINMIPKDGGNRISGSFFTTGSNTAMQGNNLTSKLKAQGLNSVNTTRSTWDVNGFVGGPLMKDRLWFMVDSRNWGRVQGIPDLYEDSNYDDWVYTPDRNKPVRAPEHDRQHDLRLTWQATEKNKFTYQYGWQHYFSSNNQGQLSVTGTAWERRGNAYCPDTRLNQGTWTRPQSNKVLFEAGVTLFDFDINTLEGARVPPLCVVLNDYTPVTEQNLAFSPASWHGNGTRTDIHHKQQNGRFSVSYVTGSHHFKAGTFLMYAQEMQPGTSSPRDSLGYSLSYLFNGGAPIQVTENTAPTNRQGRLNPEFALFAQDQWTLKRLTLNYGLRFEYLQQSAPVVEIAAGLLQDAKKFPAQGCIPCWKDIDPRVAASYDLFGDGRTAVKASIGRYVDAQTTGLSVAYGPTAAAITSTTRSWTDTNSNFFPDCDLRSTAANRECGAMANPNFGGTQARIHADPNWIKGWGKRGYTWVSSIELQRELGRGIALNTGYYRTWYGNQIVTDNSLVTPADYDPYCVTAPVDPRLGSVSGTQVCGLYDIKPEKFGLVDSVVGLASKFGKVSETFNGFDVTMQARLPRGVIMSGGLSVGNAVGNGSGFGALVSARIKRCFVVDSPQELYNCAYANPTRASVRLNGSIPLRWGLQGAAVFQNLPPLNYAALTTYSSAQVAASLGRPLAGGTRTVTVDMLQPYSTYLDGRINQLDLRLSKKWKTGRTGIQLNSDLYNAMNASPVLNINSTYGTNGVGWLKPSQVLDARLFKMGVQVDF